ncbi:hypothetical protein FRC17_000350 [Serendipita sp. 399]|nr:hypothetical protein FRC17_000350 [Serendipita sp. 399]
MLKYNTNRRMHRIQIDEAEGTVLATIGFGNTVKQKFPRKSRSPLWVNPMVGGWAHCEFDKGFLIWGRGVAKIDIWRREIDQREDPLPACDPDEFQRGISGLIRRMEQEGGYRDDLPGIRGRFEPFVCLHTETATSASRFVYPHLVLATRDAQIAYIYDVPSAKLLRKIELNPDNTVGLEGDDRVNYVEQSQTHVFVCMERQIVTYKKSDGAVDLIFRARQPPTHMLSIDPQDPGFEEEDDEEEGYGSWETTKKLPLCSIEDRSLLFKHFAHSALRTFQAVHVSPCGRIWVAICDESFIYVVTGGLEGTGSALEITEIYLGVEELHYLAFDGYHIAVAGDRGICTLSLGRLHESDDDLHLIHERIQRSSLQVFRPAPDVIMGETTCLQITDDSVWHVAAVGASGLTAGLERIQFGERLGGDQDEDD